MNNFQQHLNTQLAKLPPPKTRVSGQRFATSSSVIPLRDHHFTDCRFSGLELVDAQWSGLIFQQCEFTALHFKNAVITDCHFIDCRLTDCRFDDCQCQDWVSQKTDWLRCNFQRVQSQTLSFQGGEWQSLSMLDCESEHWNILKLDVMELRVKGGYASDWNICQSTLSKCSWRDTALIRQVAGECQLSAISLKNLSGLAPVWFACHWQQSDLRDLRLNGGSFHRNHFAHCDFGSSHFTGTVMCEAIWQECQLNATRFERIQGQKIEMHGCSLTNSDWLSASLQHSIFSHCYGENIHFTASDLRGAQLSGLPNTTHISLTRVHSADSVPPATEPPSEPVLDAIADWYTSVQPGPSHLRSELMTLGASRYV
jgi:uncharacterized protein YjbI with pentapeptide repeats